MDHWLGRWESLRAALGDPRPVYASERSSDGGRAFVAASEGALRELLALPAAALGARRSAWLPRGWADRSAFFTSGAEHARARRAIASGLDRQRLEAHVPLLRAIARDVLEEGERRGAWWSPGPLGPAPHAVMLAIASRSMGALLLGARVERAMRADLEAVLAPLDRPWAFAPPLRVELFGRTPWGRFVRATRRVRAALRARAAQAAGPSRGADEGALDAMARQGGDDPELLVDQAITMLATGREPVAAALSWAVEMLAADAVAEREARDAVRALGAEPSIDALRGCVPLERAIERALSRAVVPEIARRLARDETIAGRRLPAGTEIVGAICLHTERAPSLAFGGGAHGCMGAELARLTMRVVLAEHLRRPTASARAPRAGLHAVRRNLVLVPRAR